MKKNLLLVLDDDDNLRYNVRIYLEDEGYSCIGARDSETALKIVGKENIVLSIVDLRLPGMNGEEYIKRAVALNPQMKFIIHTGSTRYILPPELSRLGIKREDIFYKPVENLDLIVGRIKQHI
jgi:DNA-binding NtrC family response regulator